ncbi:hypothetical protein [Cellulomonas biazotea]|uniref:Uncharacterized protein n=1 Tax=Cellulomonas biazotea TaxID=1709 RepID=A0A402DSL2_9CELL|nr:hypothetical protein [Cellulomonas biazotea]GCE77095.1 hypothetical protein CBZ_21510 [Cellulomonas biazotea]
MTRHDPTPVDARLASKVVRRVGRRLTGRERDGVRVAMVFHYGAVTLDPKHLVVWLLLDGRPSDELPEWLAVTPTLLPSLRPESVDYEWLLALRTEICDAFRDAGWPDPDGVDVLVDSAERVKAHGGWNYFR